MTQNDPKRSSALLSEIRDPTSQTNDSELKSGSYAPKIDFKSSHTTQQYNLSLNQEKALNENNFITLGKIPKEEKIEII